MKRVLRQLLSAVQEVHSAGLLHRDIKPGNVVVKKGSFDAVLIDFGLSEFYFPGKEYNVRIATRPFKPPEVLLNYQKYFQSFDVWGLGSILGCLVSVALQIAAL